MLLTCPVLGAASPTGQRLRDQPIRNCGERRILRNEESPLWQPPKRGRANCVPKKRVATAEPKQEKPVTLTLKVDGKTYVRLCTLRATQRRTHQDIIREEHHPKWILLHFEIERGE